MQGCEPRSGPEHQCAADGSLSPNQGRKRPCPQRGSVCACLAASLADSQGAPGSPVDGDLERVGRSGQPRQPLVQVWGETAQSGGVEEAPEAECLRDIRSQLRCRRAAAGVPAACPVRVCILAAALYLSPCRSPAGAGCPAPPALAQMSQLLGYSFMSTPQVCSGSCARQHRGTGAPQGCHASSPELGGCHAGACPAVISRTLANRAGQQVGGADPGPSQHRQAGMCTTRVLRGCTSGRAVTPCP